MNTKRSGLVCQDCGRVYATEDELIYPFDDVFERVLPGERMPSGECPECGALVNEIEGEE